MDSEPRHHRRRSLVPASPHTQQSGCPRLLCISAANELTQHLTQHLAGGWPSPPAPPRLTFRVRSLRRC